MNMVAIYLVVFFDETIRGITNYIYYKRKYLNTELHHDAIESNGF